jgi:hypothetical protein
MVEEICVVSKRCSQKNVAEALVATAVLSRRTSCSVEWRLWNGE